LRKVHLRIGTRGSPLALAQAREVANGLINAHGLAPDAVAISIIKTTGDEVLDRPLSEVGGKGLFTKEIEEALLAGKIDVAVHSMKDMETRLPAGLALGAVLCREDPRDAFISLRHANLLALPKGAVVGTSSLRRRSQVMNIRPDLRVVDFRGNVQTRCRKLEEEGTVDATFLAVAGLKRMGLEKIVTSPMAIDEMIPAVGQGAIGLEIRSDDPVAARLTAPMNDASALMTVLAERAFLARLDGSCRTAIAGHAFIERGVLIFLGQLLSSDGKISHRIRRIGKPRDAVRVGLEVADSIIALTQARRLSV
jgi:hydroxymethylbilane synthase